MAQINIPTSGLWSTIASALNTMFGELFGRTGWGDYADTQFTEASPFSVVGGVDTLVPNNKGQVIETQKPTDVTTFYDGAVITGRNKDGILITIDLKAKPTAAGTSIIDFWLDIGGTVGRLYQRPVTFPKGVGVERPISFSISGYTLNTWEANGARLYCNADAAVDLYDIRYVITRTHKAR